MNPNTGHLVNLDNEGIVQRLASRLVEYERVPRHLEADAQRKLAGRAEAQVNLMSRTPLAKWAKKKRLAKIAAKSRRRNRK